MTRIADKETSRHIIQEIGKKDAFVWLRDALLNWSVIITSFYIFSLYPNILTFLVAVLIIGNRQHALAILGHDGTHYTIHKNKEVNDNISDMLALWPIGMTTKGYRILHFQHHQHLNTANDPELMHRSSKAPQWDLPITVWRVLKMAVMDMGGYSLTDYSFIVKYTKGNSPGLLYRMIAYNILITLAFVVAGLWWVPLMWYFSLPTAFMMYFRLRTWLEHQGSEDTHRLKLNWFERLLLSPHGVWHHYEHHLYPTVPCQKLHKVREILPGKPVMTLKELLLKYAQIAHIKSGEPVTNRVHFIEHI